MRGEDGRRDMQINGLINEIWEKLMPDGRNNVRDYDKLLKSVDLKEQSDPEAFTKHFLIEKILDLLNLEVLPENNFSICIASLYFKTFHAMLLQ